MEPTEDTVGIERMILTRGFMELAYIPVMGTTHNIKVTLEKATPVIVSSNNLMGLLLEIETVLINYMLLADLKKPLKSVFSEVEPIIKDVLMSFTLFLGDDMLTPDSKKVPKEPKSRLIL